jgi:hypothetical protein
MEPKPLSNDTRFYIEEQLRKLPLEPLECWFTKNEMCDVLVAEAFWRETVKNLPLRVRQARPGLYEGYLQCPVCHSGFDRKEDTFNPDVHDDGCPWLLAHSEKETLAPPTV